MDGVREKFFLMLVKKCASIRKLKDKVSILVANKAKFVKYLVDQKWTATDMN